MIIVKKIISTALAFAMLLTSAIAVFAEPCTEHEYVPTHVPANCSEKAYTVYTCKECGDNYKIYDDEYTAPDGFYLLAQSKKEDGKITLEVHMYNNPGLSAAVLRVYHNPSAVTVDEIKKGDVWTSGSFNTMHTEGNDYISVYAEADGIKNNGLFFSAVYDVTDECAESGIRIYVANKSFVDFDDDALKTIDRNPQVVDIIGKSDLGDHSWILSRVIEEPGFEETGEAEYVCDICGSTKTEILPAVPRWEKGDLDNSGSINTKDSYLIKKYLSGYRPEDSLKWFEDAADINGDGKINAEDSVCMKRIIMGR